MFGAALEGVGFLSMEPTREDLTSYSLAMLMLAQTFVLVVRSWVKPLSKNMLSIKILLCKLGRRACPKCMKEVISSAPQSQAVKQHNHSLWKGQSHSSPWSHLSSLGHPKP